MNLKPGTREAAAREAILERVREALADMPRPPVSPVPKTTRITPRTAGEADTEIALLLATVEILGGHTLRVSGRVELETALSGLVESEGVKRATLWSTLAPGIEPMLHQLGVEIVSPQSDKRLLAECDLGITGADAALAETGTLVLRSSPSQPAAVSLLPRVHVAIFRPEVICPDLSQLFGIVKHDKHVVLVSGPSRTADIEKTLALGVHGPKALYVWCREG